MKIQYPIIVYVFLGIIALLSIVLLVVRRKTKYHGGLRVANSNVLLDTPEFKAAMRKFIFLTVLRRIAVIVEIVSILFVIANPYIEKNVIAGVKKRDIMLCMDTGFYLDDLNSELINSYEDVIRGLDSGDRVGISLYSSSTLTYVPLTDDFDYVIERLELLKEYFELGIKLDQYYGSYYNEHGCLSSELEEEYDVDYERMEDLYWISNATHVHSDQKGHFLVGDGIASCLYSFPALKEEERTRIIILSTDNADALDGYPVVELDEACQLCAKYDVRVYALFRGEAAFNESAEPNNFFLYAVESDDDYSSASNELRDCIEITDGKFYEYGKGMTPKQIIEDIENTEAKETKEIVVTKKVNMPRSFIIAFMVSLMLFIFTSLMLQGGTRSWKK